MTYLVNASDWRSLLDEIKKQGYGAELTGGQRYDRAKD
jgi:hypothetical protein